MAFIALKRSTPRAQRTPSVLATEPQSHRGASSTKFGGAGLPSRLHRLRKGVPQAVEEPIGPEEQDHRHAAERHEPFPVSDFAREEQDFLVRDSEVCERIQVEEPPV